MLESAKISKAVALIIFCVVSFSPLLSGQDIKAKDVKGLFERHTIDLTFSGLYRIHLPRSFENNIGITWSNDLLMGFQWGRKNHYFSMIAGYQYKSTHVEKHYLDGTLSSSSIWNKKSLMVGLGYTHTIWRIGDNRIYLGMLIRQESPSFVESLKTIDKITSFERARDANSPIIRLSVHINRNLFRKISFKWGMLGEWRIVSGPTYIFDFKGTYYINEAFSIGSELTILFNIKNNDER